jgi:hypothetical protein
MSARKIPLIRILTARRVGGLTCLSIDGFGGGEFTDIFASRTPAAPVDDLENAVLSKFLQAFSLAESRIWLFISGGTTVGSLLSGVYEERKANESELAWIRQHSPVPVRVDACETDEWQLLSAADKSWSSFLVEVRTIADLAMIVDILWPGSSGFIALYPKAGETTSSLAESISKLQDGIQVDETVLQHCHTELFTASGDYNDRFLIISELPDALERAKRAVAEVNRQVDERDSLKGPASGTGLR